MDKRSASIIKYMVESTHRYIFEKQKYLFFSILRGKLPPV
jgi:hypothetical protein